MAARRESECCGFVKSLLWVVVKVWNKETCVCVVGTWRKKDLSGAKGDIWKGI